jgi:hypothetical protein
LHRLFLCSGVWHGLGLFPCILFFPDLCSVISLGPNLCPCILQGPNPPVLFRRPNLCGGILRNLCRGILHGLYWHDLCPCIFLGRPSLELLEQGFIWRLTDLGLTLIGRFNSRGNFVARRRVRCRRRQILSAGE